MLKPQTISFSVHLRQPFAIGFPTFGHMSA